MSNDAMGHEVFQDKRGNKMTVTISPNNDRVLIRLSRPVLDALNSPRSIIFLFDAECRSVGIKAADQDEQFAYQLSPAGHSKTKSCCFTNFARHYQIEIDETKTYPVEMVGDMATFTLAAGTSEGQVELAKTLLKVVEETNPELRWGSANGSVMKRCIDHALRAKCAELQIEIGE